MICKGHIQLIYYICGRQEKMLSSIYFFNTQMVLFHLNIIGTVQVVSLDRYSKALTPFCMHLHRTAVVFSISHTYNALHNSKIREYIKQNSMSHSREIRYRPKRTDIIGYDLACLALLNSSFVTLSDLLFIRARLNDSLGNNVGRKIEPTALPIDTRYKNLKKTLNHPATTTHAYITTKRNNHQGHPAPNHPGKKKLAISLEQKKKPAAASSNSPKPFSPSRNQLRQYLGADWVKSLSQTPACTTAG